MTGTETYGIQLRVDDFRFKGDNPLATITAYGKGKIAGVYLNVGNLPQAPTEVKLQPENVSLPFENENGNTVIHLSKLNIHSIIEIQD